MKAHQVLLRKILILIEDKSHYLSVLPPQIGATWMQRGTINKTELFMYEPVLLVGETGTGKTTLVQNLAARLGQKLTVLVCLLRKLDNGTG